MTMTKISERREVLTYPGDDGQTAYVGMWVDGLQIGAGLRQDDGFAEYHRGDRWLLWSSGLTSMAMIKPDAPRPTNAASPLPVRDEAGVRAWLNLLADLAEHGAKVVEGRTL